MIVLLPVCKKDIDAALRNLAWCLQLNPTRQPFTCVISREQNFNEAGSVAEAARRCFTNVRENLYPPFHGSVAWPIPQNAAFRAACLAMARQGEPWLWWEQDAIPLVPDAFATIARAYEAGKRPFMGARGTSDNPNRPAHLNGVAVYPPDACRVAPNLIQSSLLPFDVMGGARVLNQAQISPLFQHVWSWGGLADKTPPTFGSEVDMEKISSDAVIFHRCKDGSLIERLSVRATTHAPKAPQLKASLLQILMRWKYGSGRWMIWKRPEKPKAIASGPKLVHCLERHKQNSDDAARRVEQAQESWVALYKSGGVIPAHVWEPDRNSEQIGDGRRLPFLKDVLVAGLNAGGQNDHVMFTNDDTLLHPRILDYLIRTLAEKPAVSSFRINFDRQSLPTFACTPEQLLEKSHKLQPRGDNDLGRDLFAFRKDWLREHWHDIPDMLLGELEWDLVLAYLIRRDAGIQTTKFNMDKLMPECEMPKGYVIHERHNRQWTSRQFEASAAKRWNRKLATEFYCDNEMHFLITNQL